jgi:hypothetical protein
MEQGVDALLEFQVFLDQDSTNTWSFANWYINATVSDQKGKQVYPAIVDARPGTGLIRLILPEATVNTLRVNKSYRYDCLLAAPGNNQAENHYLASGPVSVQLRTSRRDP